MTRSFGGGRGVDSRTKTILVISGIFLLVFVTLGFLFVFSSSTNTPAAVVIEQEPKIETTQVLIPLQQIAPGTKLEPGLFRVETRSSVGLSARIIKGLDEIQGMYARSSIPVDQPLHSEYLTNVRPISAISSGIPEGFRAVTIRVDARSSVEGWARPGARVDVVWATSINGEQVVKTIVSNVKVLSAERLTDADVKAQGQAGATVGVPNTVTLLVSVDDANKIQFASLTGSLSLNLLGDVGSNSTPQNNSTIKMEDLIQGGKKKVDRRDKVKIRRPDGSWEELVLDEEGQLSPSK